MRLGSAVLKAQTASEPDFIFVAFSGKTGFLFTGCRSRLLHTSKRLTNRSTFNGDSGVTHSHNYSREVWSLRAIDNWSQRSKPG